MGSFSQAGTTPYTSAIPTVAFSDGRRAPALAYGSGTAWFKGPGQDDGKDEALVKSVTAAIDLGYTHIDAAEVYGTESEVGLGIKASRVPREKLFVTSKVWQTLPDCEAALRASLSRLGLSSLDLFLIHAPFKFTSPSEIRSAWAQMEKCVDLGLTKSIGVSNFRISDLEALLPSARIRPVVNQIEFHPYLQSPELVSFCRKEGIVIASYGTLAPIIRAPGGPLDPVLSQVSEKLGRTPAQVLLRWALQKGCLVVTTSGKEERLREYLGVTGLELSPDDVAHIDAAGEKKEYRRFWVKDFAKL